MASMFILSGAAAGSLLAPAEIRPMLDARNRRDKLSPAGRIHDDPSGAIFQLLATMVGITTQEGSNASNPFLQAN